MILNKDSTPDEIRGEWTRRLREPGRKQVTGVLHMVDGGQCCLGVLCEMAFEAGVADRKRVVRSGDSPQVWEYLNPDGSGGSYLMPPAAVREWAGIEDDGFLIRTGHDDVIGAADANDRHHMTFAAIASGIERVHVHPPERVV